MRAEVIVTLIGVGLLVAALAIYLSIIAYHLTKVSFTLGTVLIGVRAIANQTEPLDGVVGSIATDVAAMDDALKALVEVATAPTGPSTQDDEPVDSMPPTQQMRRGRPRVSSQRLQRS
jgi:hypothetical protein